MFCIFRLLATHRRIYHHYQTQQKATSGACQEVRSLFWLRKLPWLFLTTLISASTNTHTPVYSKIVPEMQTVNLAPSFCFKSWARLSTSIISPTGPQLWANRPNNHHWDDLLQNPEQSRAEPCRAEPGRAEGIIEPALCGAQLKQAWEHWVGNVWFSN